MKTLITLLALAVLGAANTTFAAAPTTCVVSGEKLGEMGKSYFFTYEGQAAN